MDNVYALGSIFWSPDPATQRAVWLVLGVAIAAAIAVYLPLAVRLLRLYRLERDLREIADEISPSARNALLEDFKALLVASLIQGPYEEFERRWRTARLSEDGQRAPVRLIDILDERPLLPFGPRRSLLPVLPGILLAAGTVAALTGLIPSFSDPGALGLRGDPDASALTVQLGLAMRAVAWGFLCAMGASLVGRLIEGAFDARSHGLDDVVESAFAAISPGELAELTRRTQQSSLESLGRELTRFANEHNERLDRGLQRIEQSTARAANLVSQEQRGALHTIVGELSLSMRQGVEHHLGELRGALQRAIEHQNSVTDGLSETFQNMADNSKTQERVAQTLDQSARAVEEAARAMRASSIEMQPVLEHLNTTSESLAKTAERITDTQRVVARTADGVRTSLEHAASGVDDQRQFIELSLTEIRQALVGLGDGLGDSLKRSLREVDEVLGRTVTSFRDTLAESNETIDRLSSPIRAVEGSSREIHLALDRVRGEVEVLGQWMNQASKPLRSGIADVDVRAEEIGRTLSDFNNHMRQIDKTMEALRHEIHEESRRLQGVGSDLGRRLQQTSDAVGLLEATTSDAARRARPGPDPARPRPRKWSPPSTPPENAEPAPPTTPKPRATETTEPGFSAMTPTPTSDSTTSRSNSPGSGYRVGSPKAQGPDPYQRFDRPEEAPSNVRHFPTPERELGQELKLSGLLSPRAPEESEAMQPTDPDDLDELLDEDSFPNDDRD